METDAAPVIAGIAVGALVAVIALARIVRADILIRAERLRPMSVSDGCDELAFGEWRRLPDDFERVHFAPVTEEGPEHHGA
jgi:hypothetical protein